MPWSTGPANLPYSLLAELSMSHLRWHACPELVLTLTPIIPPSPVRAKLFTLALPCIARRFQLRQIRLPIRFFLGAQFIQE